jgi:O-antigen/teichoic acid export membrane protein
VKALWRSPTLRTVAVYGASGLAFAGANLILARVLSTGQYGLFTLVMALVNLGAALAPVGIDGIVNRKRLEAGPRLFRRTLSVGLVVGVVFLAISELAYGLDGSMLAIIFISTVGGGAMWVAGAQFQSEQRYGRSLALTQSPNLLLLLTALALTLTSVREAWLPLVIFAFGYVFAAAYGWRVLLGERKAKPYRGSSFPLSEALAFAGLNAVGMVLLQLDRLIIPQVLTMHDLATFGVLAAIAGSLFRVLSMGVGYTLLPRLRAAQSVVQQRRLIAHEARLVGVIVIAGSAMIWVITPFIERWFLAGKYHLAASLVGAAIVSGVAKIADSFAKSTVSALGTAAELSLVNLLGWASVAISILAAVIGARWGLAGVMLAVGLGWLIRAFVAFYLTMRHLKLPAGVPATSSLSSHVP